MSQRDCQVEGRHGRLNVPVSDRNVRYARNNLKWLKQINIGYRQKKKKKLMKKKIGKQEEIPVTLTGDIEVFNNICSSYG